MDERLKQSLWKHLNSNKLLRSLVTFLLLFASGVAAVFLIQYFQTTIVIFTISATLAALLNFPVRWVSRYLPRGLAIALVSILALVGAGAFIVALGLEIVNQGQGLASSLNDFLTKTDLAGARGLLKNINLESVLRTLQSGLVSGVGILQGAFSNFLNLVFIIVICIYMLIDGTRIWSFCLRLLPPELRDRFGGSFQRSFVGFFKAQFLLVGFLALTVYIVFSLLGVKYALFLSLIVAVIDAIPGIGGTLCAIVVTILVLMSQGWWMGLQVLVACTVLQQIQDNLISPKLMQENLNINPVLLFLALFIGERIAGILGIFLAIPLVGMIISLMNDPSPPVPQDELPPPPENN
jgi:predicted PurR-regulated permease PerM